MTYYNGRRSDRTLDLETPTVHFSEMVRRGRVGSLLTRCWVAYITSTSGWPLDLCRYGWNIVPPQHLQYVQEESKKSFDADLPALEAARRMDLGPYEAWHEPERLLFNVERAYRELRGDPPISTVDVFSLITGVIQLRQERWPERA